MHIHAFIKYGKLFDIESKTQLDTLRTVIIHLQVIEKHKLNVFRKQTSKFLY